MKNWEKLEQYLVKPLKTTVLVICYKNGTIDARKKFLNTAANVGVVMRSDKLRDNAVPTFIENYVKSKNATIEQKAKMMIADFIGADLSRVASEIDKTLIAVVVGGTLVAGR